jgi:mRNA-degrading endonuclease toxin of MazEF toxin-antitoxin module
VPNPSQGRIVIANVPDPQDGNPKDRPVIIITPTEEITESDPFAVMAITSALPRHLPREYVELPFHRDGQVRTGLKKRCAAKCDWVTTIRAAEIIAYIGHAPPDAMKLIAEYLAYHPDS